MIAKIKTVDEIVREEGSMIVNEKVEEIVSKVNEIVEYLNNIESGMRTR